MLYTLQEAEARNSCVSWCGWKTKAVHCSTIRFRISEYIPSFHHNFTTQTRTRHSVRNGPEIIVGVITHCKKK
ncbi:hypothetical protein E2C01_013199 [Portunus trituberculatus]|uniref:Uncharacterized protein n=1 Tax=Portunus trituberculatus TaxID=210409 RepID=A0A5B7DGA6_PORTR|nr:hypothetical protein [Portunus trituberculatus]